MWTCRLGRHGFLGRNLSVVVLLWLMPTSGLAQQEEVARAGQPTYAHHCVGCHGLAGKGDGAVANILTLKPADLTQLSKNNGGEFPFWRVYRVIDGREEAIRGHGSREMPIWGKKLRATAGSGNTVEESIVRGRILELIYYLQSIQEK
ncbi:MAG: cytochrome c [Candidatus Binatia bacterium]